MALLHCFEIATFHHPHRDGEEHEAQPVILVGDWSDVVIHEMVEPYW